MSDVGMKAVLLAIGGKLLVCYVQLAFVLRFWAKDENSEIWKEELERAEIEILWTIN